MTTKCGGAKQTKKLDSVNQKLEELIAKKHELENEMIQSISKQVAALLIKKHATDIDMKLFLQMVDSVIDEMVKKG